MLRRLILLATFVARAALAADVQVGVVDRSNGACTRSHVHATSANAEVRVPITRDRASYNVTLDEKQSWRVSVSGEGCWSTQAEWISAHPAPVSIDVFAAATIAGDLRGANSLPRLHAMLFREGLGPAALGDPLDCAVDAARWRCRIPAGVSFDLRLEPPGFAPLYFWDVVARPDEIVAAAPQRLIAGASLSGWVYDDDGAAAASVTLTPADNTTSSAARTLTAKTTTKGFFQFAPLAPGDYRLVARAEKLAPAMVPVIKIREGEAVVWPRRIVLVPPVTLNVRLDPPTDTDGRRWLIELEERLPIEPRQPLRRAASDSGEWSASGLRADVYDLVVRDAANAAVERTTVDLTNGAPAELALHIGRIPVRGKLTAGDEPVEAELRFANREGKTVRARTDEEGQYETVFPSAGEWTITVRPGGRRTEIRAGKITVPERDAAPATIDIVLKGGRVRGEVVTVSGDAVRAAVHAQNMKTANLAAQQITESDGVFDFIGLAEGDYELSAEAEDGRAARPVRVSVTKRDPTEVKLVVERTQSLRGSVVTPTGLPASGAIVRISVDGGVWWDDIHADVNGDFEYRVTRGTARVDLIVLTHSYPAAIVVVPLRNDADTPVAIALGAVGGRLHAHDESVFVLRGRAVAPMRLLRMPPEFGHGAPHLEPGRYAVCRTPQLSDQCREVVVTPGGTTVVDAETPAR